MRFVDQIFVEATAGKGCDGVASFAREMFTPTGGPNGGDGGWAIFNLIIRILHILRSCRRSHRRNYCRSRGSRRIYGDGAVHPTLPE